jgi:hypothetical protein
LQRCSLWEKALKRASNFAKRSDGVCSLNRGSCIGFRSRAPASGCAWECTGGLLNSAPISEHFGTLLLRNGISAKLPHALGAVLRMTGIEGHMLEDRRRFLAELSLALFACGCKEIRTTGAPTPGASRRTASAGGGITFHPVPLSDELLQRSTASIRPLLHEKGVGFDRDRELIGVAEKWLGNILLGSKYHSLPFKPDDFKQLPNVRPDCATYVLRVTDTAFLRRVVETAEVKTGVAKGLLAALAKKQYQICWGSLYWMRQIKKDHRHPDNAKAPDAVEEVYWLNVVYALGDYAVPLITVYFDSLGIYSPPERAVYSLEYVKAAIPADPYYTAPNTLLLGWHDVAARLGLQSNYYYLRACFTGANFESDVTAKASHTLKRVVLFRREGVTDVPDWVVVQLLWPRPFDESKPYGTQISEFATATLNDLRPADLSQPASFIGQPLPTDWSYRRHDPITAPAPKIFPEESRAGRDFVFFISSQYPGVHYEGDGFFSLAFALSGAAAAGGVRGSGFIETVVPLGTVAAGTAGGIMAAGGGVLAWGGAALGDRVTAESTSSPARVRQQEAIRAASLDCVKKIEAEYVGRDSDGQTASPSSASLEARCMDCVRREGSLQQETEDMNTDAWNETFFNLAPAALSCGVAAAVAFIPAVNVAAWAACAIAGGVALAYGLGATIGDHLENSAATQKLENEAFAPCRRIGGGGDDSQERNPPPLGSGT